MKKHALCLMILSLTISGSVHGINTTDTRLMHQPAISNDHIAFIYANDLWIAGLDGSNPARLTSDLGVESNPFFSPDGETIAFSAEYDGNTDVFTIPSRGGMPRRLTWHPSPDQARGFSPDGKAVLFASPREDFSNRNMQLYLVSLEGGFPAKLTIPNAHQATYSPDGRRMAYTPMPPAFTQWKNYRGGTHSIIQVITLDSHSSEKIPQPEGRCNDWYPMWVGDYIYFLSDRNGEFNLFSFHTASKNISQLTHYSDFPVVSAAIRGNHIIFEQAGKLHLYNTLTASVSSLKIGLAAELPELRPRFASGTQHIRHAHISPSGARAVFGFRGDIITLPAEKGDPRNLTATAGSHEKYPAWSPDGRFIAYFSDESGEYQLIIAGQDGKGEPRKFDLDGKGSYAYITWSPDSKHLVFNDNGRNLYLMEVQSGKISLIDSDVLYTPGPFREKFSSWSSDSRWIAYNQITETNFRQVFVYSVDEGKSYPVTDGLSNAENPVFDPDGKYLVFLASTDAGPALNWFDLSNVESRMTFSLYLVTLRKDIPNPFLRESDEEEPAKATEEPGVNESSRPDNKKTASKSDEKPAESKPVMRIDWDGIENRIVSIPAKAGYYSQLTFPKPGEILFVAAPADRTGSPMLMKFDMKERKVSEVMDLDQYVVSADGKKMLYRAKQAWGITDTGKKPEPGKGQLNTASLEVRIDPAAEWKQIFDEAWRINRDYFYDPGMHGADWAAMKEKYAAFLPDVPTRNDLNRLMGMMCSEIAVGHLYIAGGDQKFSSPRIEVGLLGADFETVNNRYRIRKIYGGLNWNPGLRSPLTEPGIQINEGDYIIAVNGRNVTAGQNIYSFFEKTAGRTVELTVSSDPDGNAPRTSKVEPVSSESSLRNRDWVERNLRRVHEATNGRVAYVYVPNTSTLGHEYFKRYFFPQAGKEAVIIDERYNGGGLIADYYIDLLTKPFQANWATRYGKDLKTPGAIIHGPKVMIINEQAGSGGDMLPWMFRKFKVGKLVGKTTWGGLVGILGFPELMDGGFITAPNVAIWTEDGFIVENTGVDPDIEVDMLPAEVLGGKDPQLEKAIEVILEEMRLNPEKQQTKPPYPVRAIKR